MDLKKEEIGNVIASGSLMDSSKPSVVDTIYDRLSSAGYPEVLKMLGPNNMVCASGVVHLDWTFSFCDTEWMSICDGLGLLVMDCHNFTFSVIVLDTLKNQIPFRCALESLIFYKCEESSTHLFRITERLVKMTFVDENESVCFYQAVQKELNPVLEKKQKGNSETENTSLYKLLKNRLTVSMPSLYLNSKRKMNRSMRIHIGNPSNFRHLVHVGPIPRPGYYIENQTLDLNDPVSRNSYDQVMRIKSLLQKDNDLTSKHDYETIMCSSSDKVVPGPTNNQLVPQVADVYSENNPIPKPPRSHYAYPPRRVIPATRDIVYENTTFLPATMLDQNIYDRPKSTPVRIPQIQISVPQLTPKDRVNSSSVLPKPRPLTVHEPFKLGVGTVMETNNTCTDSGEKPGLTKTVWRPPTPIIPKASVRLASQNGPFYSDDSINILTPSIQNHNISTSSCS